MIVGITNNIQSMKPIFHERRGVTWHALKCHNPATNPFATYMATMSLMPVWVLDRYWLP
jgi:hypothetical protein